MIYLIFSEYHSYFLQSQKVRRLIAQDFSDAFRKVDAILVPVSANHVPPLINQPSLSRNEDYANDLMTVPASLAGLPSIALPFGPEKAGMQVIGPYRSDDMILKLAKLLEEQY